MSAFEDSSGKVSSERFKQLVRPRTGARRDDVVTGPAYGVDTAVINLGNGQGLATSSDPLSLIPSLGLQESAWLTVHLLANDMATTGFAPQYAQFVLNLPPETTEKQFAEYWGYIDDYCKEAGIAITGGHTAQVPGQASTTPGGGTMFLRAPLEDIITADGGEPGDVLVITKESALTASSILAKSFPETVIEACGRDIWEQGCANFYRTSSLDDALAAADILQPNEELKAMHDVTEGGLLGGLSELAEASGCGFRVKYEALPTGEAPEAICSVFDIDPRHCVGAGAMIMAVQPGTEEQLTAHLKQQGIPAAVVGTLTPKEEGTVLVKEGREEAFTFDGNDPYWNAFFNAMEQGWK